MDFLRIKKALATAAVFAISFSTFGSALAAHSYSDVASGVWYEGAVNNLVDAGVLDASQSRFRGGENANRAEFVKLVVELNGGILSTPPAVPSFADVPAGAWFFEYLEEAGKEGWVRGDGDCYGNTPCYARPGANINRAEAAALIVRAFGLEPTGASMQFVDNPSGQWYTSVIQTAADYCVLQGDDGSGRVRPGDNMNRAEMVVMLDRVDQGLVYGLDCGSDDSFVNEPMMVDVVPTSATTIEVEFSMALDLDAAEDLALYDITGGLSISSVELVADDLVEITLDTAMAANEDYTLSVDGMMTNDGTEFSDALSFSGYSPIVTGDGVLEVSLSSSSPVSDTVPRGAIGVVMLSVDLTASCDDSVILEDMTVLHEGFGDETDINGVYAAIDGARVTRKRTIDSEDQTAELRFASPLVVDPCETVTVDLVADFETAAAISAEHNFVVELPSDVISNAADVMGNFPVRGNTFRVAAVTSGTITIEYRTTTPDEVEVGDTGVVVGKFETSVDSAEDQTLYAITLEQNSSASDGDFTNIAIRRTDGTVLTNTVSSTVGDFVTLVFDPPFTILEGDKITLEVIADIVGGAGDSIIMHFEENSDLFAVGSLYGYGVNGQLYGSQVTLPTETALLPDTVNIDAGEFTIGIDGPATQDYTRDDNDAVLANIEFATGGEKIDIKDIFVAVQAQTVTGAVLCANGGASATACPLGTGGGDDEIFEILEDVELRNTVTGRTIDGVRLTAAGTSGQNFSATVTAQGTFQIYRFDDFIVHGDETWELRNDYIDNGAGNHPLTGDKFRAHICGEPTHILSAGTLIANTTGCDFGGLITSSTSFQMEVEGLSTGDNVGDVRPRGNIAGNFHRIANATLTIAVKNLNSVDSGVENAKDITLLRFEARAGEAEDILATKFVFEALTGSLQNIQNYALWVDTDNDGTVDTIMEDGVASQNSTVTFADMAGGGFIIHAEETTVFEVHGDVASSLVNALMQLRFATGSSVTFIEAEELDDGSSLSGLQLNGTFHGGVTSADIIVSTVNSTLWSLVSQGDLFVTQDSTPLRTRQCLNGETCEPILALEFHAENEDIDVTDLQIVASGSATSVDRLELFFAGATSPFAEATVGGCGSDSVTTGNPLIAPGGTVQVFCANTESRQLIVPEGDDVTVLIQPVMKSDALGGTTNQELRLFIDMTNAANEATGSGAIRARGDESSNDLGTDTGLAHDQDTTAEGEIFIGTETPGTGAYIVGNENVSVSAKIISIVDANPDSDLSNPTVPSGLSPFAQFKFSAASHNNSNNGDNDVVVDGLIFNVTATNVVFDETSFELYRKPVTSTVHACEARDRTTGAVLGAGTASGNFIVRCASMGTGSVSTEIDEGQDATFVLQGDVTSIGSNATLQGSLQDFDDISNTAFIHNGAHIRWDDVDTAGTATFLWVEYSDTVVKSTTYNNN